MEGNNYGRQIWDFNDANMLIEEFMELYDTRPIKNNNYGMSSTHLFWTWYVVKKLQPDNIIESGVWKGQGTWLFRQTLPKVNLYCIDPILENREYIDEYATYFKEDFSLIDWSVYLNNGKTLCFFDDHQNAYMRLQQMKWMRLRHAMFEDNYPIKQGDCYSLKKVFAETGFQNSGRVIIPPNEAHSHYAKENIETYTTMPPLCKLQRTRWGDIWDDISYATPEAVLTEEMLCKYPVIADEAGGYTWICYVKLKD